MQSGRFGQALSQAEELRKRSPRDPRVLWMVGVCSAELGKHAEAIAALRSGLAGDPDNLGMRMCYADTLQRAGEHAEALAQVERVLARQPGLVPAGVLRASVLMDSGEWQRAAEAVRTLRASPELASARPGEALSFEILAARLAPEHADARETIERLEPIVADSGHPVRVREKGAWHLGRLHEKLGEHARAFAAHTTSKSVARLAWDPDLHSGMVDRLIECWGPGCDVPGVADDGKRGGRLVFILGMMRSGTSLTEQMLAQLPGVTPGGELNAISRQVAEVDPAPGPGMRPLPVSRERYTDDTIETMARDAWAIYRRVARSGLVTDKQTYNFYYAPLLMRLFPGCKIVHCVRDPQDTCLSCYFQSFARPHPQTHDLEWLGRFHRDYQRVMDAWRALPEIDMIDLPYEGLVSDPRTHLGRVLKFLGLEWDDAILRFHESDRALRTASREQVRSPLYTASVNKHERYHEHLAPLRRGLGLED